jgi:alpha-glucosidase
MTLMKRREFLAAGLAAPAAPGLLRLARGSADAVRVSSPSGAVEVHVSADAARLVYGVTFRGRPVIESSALGMLVDGVNLGEEVALGDAESYHGNDHFPTRGVHGEAAERFRGARVAVGQAILDVRAFDDGIAFRFVVPGAGSRVPDEATAFVLPAGSTVWYHDLEGHYEGTHKKKDISEVAAGDWAAPPLTFKLPNGAGYASITEAAVIDYAGMALQADGQRGFRARLGHSHPASYPFRLRYGEAEATRLAQPAAIAGRITTPWRVVIIGADLDTLVNCDIVADLSPPPDRRLFPKGQSTDWIKPGRAVWKYLDGGGENSLETMKEFSRLAGALGFEYNLVEGFWRRWEEKDLRELIAYSRQHNVGIWLWQHSRELHDPAARAAFFQHVQDVGAVGVKLDFFDHEATEVMDLYRACLQGAAEHRLLVDFHGANKPTGESRTWPNELNREAVSGMERRSMPAWAQHDTTIPFTRMLAGHLDFTPMLFGERRRETSWAHQIATAALFTAPLLVYGAHPQAILDNPAVDLIKTIPSTWDETRVLPFSEIGEVAGFARRHGKQWFVVIANGPTARSVEVPLSFLGGGPHQALLVRDREDDPAAVVVEKAIVRRDDALKVDLRAAGGFVARF